MSVTILDRPARPGLTLYPSKSARVATDEANDLSPATILTATTAEGPLPLLVAEMSIWSLGVTAGILSWSVVSAVASPMILAWNFLTPRAKAI